MSITGEDKPVKVGVAVTDMMTGTYPLLARPPRCRSPLSSLLYSYNIPLSSSSFDPNALRTHRRRGAWNEASNLDLK